MVHNTLDETMQKCKEWNMDLIIMFSSSSCKYCSKYGGKGRIYSVSGKSKRHRPLSIIPSDLVIGRCPMCDCAISFNVKVL